MVKAVSRTSVPFRLLAGFATLWMAGAAGAATPAPQPIPTDRMIVRLRDAAPLPDLSALGALGLPGGLRPLRQLHDGAWVLALPQAMPPAQIEQLGALLQRLLPRVLSSEPDLRLRTFAVPTDPMFNQQWALYDATGGIRLPQAHDLSQGKGVVVAVLDTGVRPHADLAGNLVAGHDFVSDAFTGNDGNGRDANAEDPGDGTGAGTCPGDPAGSNSSWHGTHVSGTIAALANNGVGVAGVAPQARLQPVRVLGRCGGYSSDLADGMVWAAGGAVPGVPANPTPAKVLNLSLGATGACGTTLQNAINKVNAAGATLVVAAGNEGANASNATPANCAGVIAVAATTLQGGRASYSNTGANVALAAPGGDSGAGILSTLNSGTRGPAADSYAQYIGTSMATPHVSGVAALVLSLRPDLNAGQLKQLLTGTARPFPAACSQCGSGIVDAFAAVKAVAGSAPPSTPTPAPGTAPAPAPADPVAGPPPVAVVPEAEPNDSFARAQFIATAPADVRGSLSGSDTDYFRLTLLPGQRRVATLVSAAGTNFDLVAYDAAGRTLASSNRGAGNADSITVTNSTRTGTTVYLRVVRGAIFLLSSPGGSYSLSITP